MKNKGNLEDLTDSSEEENQVEAQDKKWSKFREDIDEWVNKRKEREQVSKTIFEHGVGRYDHFSYKLHDKDAPPPNLYNPKYVEK